MDYSSIKIVGFTAGAHSCGIAYMDAGKIVCVLEEERFTRQKCFVDYENDFERFPTESIYALIDDKRFNVNFADVDYFTSFFPYEFAKEILKSILNFDLPKEKYIKIDHHESHATASYFLSGFQDDTLIFCADASGGTNNYNSKTWIGSNGKMTYVDGITNQRKSLGHFYAALTELLGFKRLKDEGKVVGLSGHGKFWQEFYHVLDNTLKVEGTKTDKDNHPVEFGQLYLDLYKNFFGLIGSKYFKSKHALADMAFTGQVFFENKVVDIINNFHIKYPHIRKLALSGGIFANVKLNKRLNSLHWVDELFVLPTMGDEGLPLGCCLAVYKKFNSILPHKLDNIFFGIRYTNDEVIEAGQEFVYRDIDFDFIVKELLDKKILALYQGRSEHGARALGNRSIICDCTHEETYKILNDKLQRNDFMPFAPAVLDEDVDMIFDVPKSKYTCEFMTMLVDTKPEWQELIPTVVHPIDKTARIQIVTAKSNPLFYLILKKYKEITGYGILVNTSFNVHNEPIVETPQNAFNHLRNGLIDHLITNVGIYSLC